MEHAITNTYLGLSNIECPALAYSYTLNLPPIRR